MRCRKRAASSMMLAPGAASGPATGHTLPSNPTAVMRAGGLVGARQRTVRPREPDNGELVVTGDDPHHRRVCRPTRTMRKRWSVDSPTPGRSTHTARRTPSRSAARRPTRGIWRRPPGVPWCHNTSRPSGSPNLRSQGHGACPTGATPSSRGGSIRATPGVGKRRSRITNPSSPTVSAWRLPRQDQAMIGASVRWRCPGLLRSGARAVAQFGSALDWGSRGRGFKSRQPDHKVAGQSRCRMHRLFPFPSMYASGYAASRRTLTRCGGSRSARAVGCRSSGASGSCARAATTRRPASGA